MALVARRKTDFPETAFAAVLVRTSKKLLRHWRWLLADQSVSGAAGLVVDLAMDFACPCTATYRKSICLNITSMPSSDCVRSCGVSSCKPQPLYLRRIQSVSFVAGHAVDSASSTSRFRSTGA